MSTWPISTILLIAILLAVPAFAGESWPQWGGPDRNFTVKAQKLSRSWGEGGPPQLWTRPLGGGFSSIVSDGKQLYIMYREGDEEFVVA